MADLITLTDYKELEGVTNTQHDARTEVIIDSVSQLVKTYCGNSIIDFYTANKVETLSVMHPTAVIQLTECPVNTLVTVQERSEIGGSYSTLSNTTDVELDKTTDTLYRISSGAYKHWEQGINSVKITYTAGYESTPADLKLAIADLVTHYLKGEHKERRTISGATIQNQKSDITFPDHIKRVLDLYKTY
jgi:hypothetical protein